MDVEFGMAVKSCGN